MLGGFVLVAALAGYFTIWWFMRPRPVLAALLALAYFPLELYVLLVVGYRAGFFDMP